MVTSGYIIFKPLENKKMQWSALTYLSSIAVPKLEVQ